MRFRKLRIAWSVACAIACVLLIAVWVRSYWWHDDITYTRTWRAIVIESELGRIDFTYAIFGEPSHGYPGWDFVSFDAPAVDPDYPTPSFQIDWKYKNVVFPHWLLVASCDLLASVPWVRWKRRFSLRTLLVATTLVAVVLGLIVAVLKGRAG